MENSQEQIAVRKKANLRWNLANNPKMREYHRRHRAKLKAQVITAYGGSCACCGESQPAFLCIDHIHGDGAKHRKEMSTMRGFSSPSGTGQDIYRYLKRNGYPKDKFQLLCINCNFAKRNKSECPHKSMIFDVFAWAGACA